MPTITQMNLRGIRSPEEVVERLRLLGYDANPLPFDGSVVGLTGEAIRLNSDRSPAKGYGVLIAEIDTVPRSLRTFARRLVEQFHDRPLAFLGVRNGTAGYRELLVVRPRLIPGGGGSVSVAKLTINVERPTAHDAEVVDGLAWNASDPEASHERINKALDVERVTKKFFEGLSEHHERLLGAVTTAGEVDPAVLSGLERAGGADRVALRIVTQLLFSYFLQRKGLLEGDRAWLTRHYQSNMTRGSFYQRVLEPLFYDALAKPSDERPEEWRRESLPFLNGGLFERHYGDVSLPIPDEVLSTNEGLLGFLDRWTFTVSEEVADESEVAVDPEMLGRIFESLIPENVLRKEGTVYTPRPVVQFMCREALVPYLEREARLDEAAARRMLLDDESFDQTTAEHGSEAALALARGVDEAVARIRVLDPAVGSGAFLLGMMGEIVRLRRLCHRVIDGRDAPTRDLWNWKLHAIERSLFGVDINPTAIELCRLRLWLSLLVEEESGQVYPLPNLEYRTVTADSLRDFVGGIEVQQTRSGALTLGFDMADPDELVSLRDRYFKAWQPSEKRQLLAELGEAEDELVDSILRRSAENAREAARRKAKKVQDEAKAALEQQLPELERQFHSRDRVFPVFLPAFHAPDVAREGGWHIVIMNPPYVGRKEVAQRFDASYRADLERHYGRTSDLMIHFGERAFELSRPGGIVSMIFNDSIFTSTDATEFRRMLFADGDVPVRVTAIARSRCFEGKAVTGGVVVAVEETPGKRPVRYVENHGRPAVELGGASRPASIADSPLAVGASELWIAERRHYRRLPHRPLFRPSPEAIALLGRFEECASWSEIEADWELLSKTDRLDTWKDEQRRAGFYDRLRVSKFVLLGLVIEGGVGLQTGDDRRFLAAIEGTTDAERALAHRERLESLALERPEAAQCYAAAREDGLSAVDALLVVSERFRNQDLGWPKTGLIRTTKGDTITRRALTDDEVGNGIEGPVYFVPFEKGDDSGEDGAARWCRTNPLVIDWSPGSVGLLRARAAQTEMHRKPRIQNQRLWGKGGVTWNAIASYLRARIVPRGSIFGHGAPVVVPTVDWLSPESLLAILNARPLDFALRTFLASRMNTHVGDIRRLPIPALADRDAERLTHLGTRAIEAKAALDRREPGEPLDEIEAELDAYVRELYGIPRDADLWVVR